MIAEFRTTIAVQAARIAELERRLGLDSSNSGTPPSRDGLTKPTAEALRQRRRSRRRASDRKPGGQTGHPGGTLRRSEHPDVITDHDPDVCTGCGAALDAGMSVGSAARQVHDLPEPPPLQVTAHRAHRCVCPACGVTTRAHFPDGVTAPVQSGPRLTARVVYLRVAQLVPVQRLRQTLIDLFGVQRSQGTLMNMVSRAAAGLEGLVLHVRDAVAAAPVKHMDETGIRVRGRLAWLHVACTGLLSHFRVGAGRGDVMRDAIGVAVHDHWRPYFTIPGTVPALCAAHLLRELQDRVDFDDEAWAATMARRFRPPTMKRNGRSAPSRCSRRSPAASVARLERRTTRCCEPCWTPPASRAGTCWKHCGPRRTNSSSGSRCPEPPRGPERPNRNLNSYHQSFNQTHHVIFCQRVFISPSSSSCDGPLQG